MTDATLSRDGPEERRRRIDAMKEAFASAIAARQAELHGREIRDRRGAWKELLLGKKSGADGSPAS
ncbi:hypothetical protein I6F07_08575 [Ensifer sp. IC4062]|nr:hypothetical protein [Ensifer sp. IC4062]MCA1440265.1 hypothetical protein [Ensifer sp. IC4062]